MKFMKKANIGALQVFMLGIVGVAVTLAIGLYVLSEVGDAMPAGSEAANATDTLIDKLGDTPTWIGILIIVFMAGLVLAYFAFRG